MTWAAGPSLLKPRNRVCREEEGPETEKIEKWELTNQRHTAIIIKQSFEGCISAAVLELVDWLA